ncbi:hypothetical protein [[Phormidium] sp. ETS-05]|nr:hypothetical protein [[Phormidium] sp. ETS-05]
MTISSISVGANSVGANGHSPLLVITGNVRHCPPYGLASESINYMK